MSSIQKLCQYNKYIMVHKNIQLNQDLCGLKERLVQYKYKSRYFFGRKDLNVN